jgi:hypothetical protein
LGGVGPHGPKVGCQTNFDSSKVLSYSHDPCPKKSFGIGEKELRCDKGRLGDRVGREREEGPPRCSMETKDGEDSSVKGGLNNRGTLDQVSKGERGDYAKCFKRRKCEKCIK